MTDAANISTKWKEEPVDESTGPLIGLVTDNSSVPGTGELEWLPARRRGWGGEVLPAPPVVPEGYYLYWRRQVSEGVVEDMYVPYECPPGTEPEDHYTTGTFKGWLKGLRAGVKRFFLGAKSPGGLMMRITYQRIARERLLIEKEERRFTDARRRAIDAGEVAPEPDPMSREEIFVRMADSKIVNVFGLIREGEDWPSSGEEPNTDITPPPSVLRGGGPSDDEEAPRGPKIIGDEVLLGPAYVVRPGALTRMTKEESAREVDVEGDSPIHSSPRESPEPEDVAELSDDSSEPPMVVRRGCTGREVPKPLKRARGRPRKDGSGPFQPPSPENIQRVEMAMEGELSPLRMEDLAPRERAVKIRRAGGMLDYGGDGGMDSGDSEAYDPTDPGSTNFKKRALFELARGSTKEIAALALDALDRVEKSRGRSKNLHGAVSHDIRVGALIARQACLALCRNSSRFGVDQAAAEALDEAQARNRALEKEVKRLERDYDIAEKSRRYLKKMGSRDPSPSDPPGRGRKRSVHERRGRSPVREHSPEWGVIGIGEPPIVPEVHMASPVGVQEVEPNRSLSPMARFAAADPQVTGVLQDIVQSLRGLEQRLDRLEGGRLGTVPAPDEGVVVAALAPTPAGKKKRTRKKRKGKSDTTDRPVGKSTPKPATPKRVTVPSARTRDDPVAVSAKTPRGTTPGKKGAKTPKREVPPTPAAVVARTPARPAFAANRAGISARKKKKRKGVGVETPTPARSQAASARRRSTPGPISTPASTVRPVGQQAGRSRKTAVKKAAKPRGAGAGVPPNQPPRTSRRKRKLAIRRRLPRTAAVGLTATSVEGKEAPKYADVMRTVRAAVPDVYATYGIKVVRPRRMATGGLLLEIPGANAAQQADALASRIREMFPEETGLRVSRPVRRVDLRLSGFDESVTPDEIAEVISGCGGTCRAEDIRVGVIRQSQRGECTVWVQAPASVGVPVAAEREITVGWNKPKVALLKGRPLKCYRCMATGHVQRRCPCPVDRTRCCFNCGEEGHFAAYCRNRPHCPPCAGRRLPANHKPGGASCVPVAPVRTGPAVPPRTRVRGDRRQCASGAGVPGPARQDSLADTEIMPGRAEGGASLGSSPRSPPGKKACVERTEELTPWEPLPQRTPRSRNAGRPGEQSTPEAVEEVEMGTQAGEGGSKFSPGPAATPSLYGGTRRVVGGTPYRGRRCGKAGSPIGWISRGV